jgi:hypothetical protein
MLLSLLRVLFGFVMACLVAGLVQVLFVITPAEIAALEPAAMGERLQGAGLLALLAATHSAVFSAPFALVVTVLGEWQGFRSWIYYSLAGLAIALAGFLAQHTGETTGATIVNDYALRAFLATGFSAGFVYWATAGRWAGARREEKPPTSRMRPA